MKQISYLLCFFLGVLRVWSAPRCCSTLILVFLKASLHVTALLEPLLINHNSDQADLLTAAVVQPKIDSLNAEVDSELRVSFGIIIKEHAWPYLFFMRTKSVFNRVTPFTFANIAIVREPTVAMMSYVRLCQREGERMRPNEVSFGGLFSLWELLGDELIIIDADDLIQNPVEIFELLCQRLEIQDRNAAVRWSSKDMKFKNLSRKLFAQWFRSVFRSTGFDQRFLSWNQFDPNWSCPDAMEETLAYNQNVYPVIWRNRLGSSMIETRV